MIEELTAENYGCLRDVRVRLTPLHALIGPNDSGKSTVLRAIRTLAQLARSKFTSSDGAWRPFDPGFREDGEPSPLIAATTPAGGYRVTTEDWAEGERDGNWVTVEGYQLPDAEPMSAPRALDSDSQLDERPDSPIGRIRSEISRAHYFAFSEQGLRAPSGFMPKTQRFISTLGAGLPGAYFALRNDREEAFEQIITKTRELFPTVKTVRAQPRSTTELELEIELTDGTRVGAAHISTGLLYFLAFVALPEFLGRGTTILLEEPENGLHPARIAEVMAVLRQMTGQGHSTQIVMATHSPLVVNELRPNEVSVITRPSVETGTIVTPIAETPNFDKRSSVYALGELWLSYADGRLEKPLFDPVAR